MFYVMLHCFGTFKIQLSKLKWFFWHIMVLSLATENVASSVCACLLVFRLLFFDDDGDSGIAGAAFKTEERERRLGKRTAGRRKGLFCRK